MAKEFRKVYKAQSRQSCAPTRMHALKIMVGLLVLFSVMELSILCARNVTTEYLDTEVEEGKDLYPNEILQSEWANEVDTADLMHLSLLHEACLNYKDSVVPWTYGLNGVIAKPSALIDKDDPDLLEKMRQCPDVDIFLPLGIRGHGYCEDSIAYTKFLESRMLPTWAIQMKYVDKKTNETYSYHDLCPKTPMIFLNHYWDDIPDSPDWPATKRIYLMPNIEMHELEAKHYWSADVVLCKTMICARRVQMWYQQEGNPRHTKVIYTRHTSSDVATLARERHKNESFKPKNWTDLQFVHTAGSSVQKGTEPLLKCWLSRPDFPPLHVYIQEKNYNKTYRNAFEKQIRDSQITLHIGHSSADEFGKMVAESAFFLCTSVQEGYGHYINQARATGALIVSTDVPPMNELLSAKSGVLVSSKRKAHKKQMLGGQYQGEHGLKNVEGLTADLKEGDEICNGVEKVLAMTPAEREEMGARAKKQYYIDMIYFASKMKELREIARRNETL